MLAKGHRIEKYQVLARLGGGGFADVYRARHVHLDTDFALKILKPEHVDTPEVRMRFLDEARVQARLVHPGIARVTDILAEPGVAGIVLEFLEGRSLDEERRRRGGRLPEADVIALFDEILDALHFAHESGVVHRDIKPENIFLRTDGKVKIMDFGIATTTGGSEGGSGRVIGTPYYMSPEQIMNLEIDGRADLYSLGITAYEMCCQDLPFDADTIQELFGCHMRAPLPDPRGEAPDLPADLLEFIEKSCAKDRDDRFKTCGDARDFLKAAAEVPVLDVFAMSSLSVTYHTSRRDMVEKIMCDAVGKLAAMSGVAFFEAHRAAGPSQAFVAPAAPPRGLPSGPPSAPPGAPPSAPPAPPSAPPPGFSPENTEN